MQTLNTSEDKDKLYVGLFRCFQALANDHQEERSCDRRVFSWNERSALVEKVFGNLNISLLT